MYFFRDDFTPAPGLGYADLSMPANAQTEDPFPGFIPINQGRMLGDRAPV